MTEEPQHDYPLPNESYHQFLRRKGRFYELILETWSTVEFYVDQLVTRQYNMNCDYADEKVQFLVRSTFERKLQFLKKMCVVNRDEFRMIHRFQEHRNQFFHTLGTSHMDSLSEQEKEQVMDEAVAAAQTTFNILSRKQGETDEESKSTTRT